MSSKIRAATGEKGKKNKKYDINLGGDKIFRKILLSVTVFVLLVLGGIFVTLIISSGLSVKRYGFKFLSSAAWDKRMTVLEKVSFEPLGVSGSYRIRLRFNQTLKAGTITKDSLVLLRNGIHRVPFTYSFETNRLTNELLIVPQEKLVAMQDYDLVVKDKIKDYSDFKLGYSYRIHAIFHSVAGGAKPDVDILDNRTSKPVPDLDPEDLRWFGALPFIIGTLLTSIIALLISIPFSLAIAIFLGEYFTTGPLSSLLQTTSELLAGIPSIIYGFWAFFFVVPVMSRWFPQAAYGGANILTASLILAVMIIPYSSSLAREVITLVPTEIKEAAQGMGATRFEVIRQVTLPYASSGIFAGVLLAFGRALGETMAVTMVIGNKNHIPHGLLDAGQTIASLIANEFAEAGDLKLSALSELGLILLTITLVFGLLGRYIIRKMSLRDQR